jgi:trigger factor
MNAVKDKINYEEVFKEASNKAINLTYDQLVEDKTFDHQSIVANSLKIELNKIDKDNLEVKYSFELFPSIQVVDYKKLKLNYQEPKVDQNEINREIDRLLQKDVMLVPKTDDVIAHGDMVNFDFKGYIDDKPFEGGEAKDYELEIGSNSFIPGFENQMVGLKRNEAKTINVQFPKDYHAKDFANKSAKFEVKINDVKTIKKPQLDEDYITKLNLPNVKTHTDLQKYFHKRILEYKKDQNIQNSIDEITKAIIDGSKIDYMPLSLLESEKRRIDDLVSKRAEEAKTTKEGYIKQQYPQDKDVSFEHWLEKQASEVIVLTMAVSKIIKELNLQVTDNDVNEHYAKLASTYQVSVDEIKQRLGKDTDRVKDYLIQDKLFRKIIELNIK